MKDVIIRITPQELMSMKAAVLDGDREGAFTLVRDLLRRAEAESNSGLKCHLDK